METSYDDAQTANELRKDIRNYAESAIHYGNVDRDWVNKWLHRLGVEPITSSARYRLNIAVTGDYGTTVVAATRAEALEKFNGYVQNLTAKGEIRASSHGQGVFNVQVTGDLPVFFSGPEDPPTDEAPELALADLRTAIRGMLKEGVSSQGWGHLYAVNAIEAMGLEPLPKLVNWIVNVPVSGISQIEVTGFEGDGDDDLQRAASGIMGRSSSVMVKPDEIGQAFTPRGGSESHFTVVDDEGDIPI